ncbi:MAG: MarR family transcriptional regulator [Bacillota bacterium]|jgi:DNA-binding MarR family transcriptional regulator|nr:MarR family transcriptional regulator [Bacillota bacterium]
MKPEIMMFLKYNNKIFRYTQRYLDRALKKYELSSGAFSYLFFLEHQEGISQNQISREIGNDKAMSARTITKLIESGHIYKIEDAKDSRAYQLYLTQKSKDILPKIHQEIDLLVKTITKDLSDDERQVTMDSLKKIFEQTKLLRGEDL